MLANATNEGEAADTTSWELNLLVDKQMLRLLEGISILDLISVAWSNDVYGQGMHVDIGNALNFLARELRDPIDKISDLTGKMVAENASLRRSATSA